MTTDAKPKTFTAYVTKYALTDGILKVQARETHTPTMITVTNRGYADSCFHGEGQDWHRTLADAQIRVKKLKQAKTRTLQRQLQKLQELDPTTMTAKAWP